MKSFGLGQISYISDQPWLPFYYTTIIVGVHNCVPNASRKIELYYFCFFKKRIILYYKDFYPKHQKFRSFGT